MSSELIQAEELQEALIDALMVARQYMPLGPEVVKEAFAENTETVRNDIAIVTNLLDSLAPKYRIIATNPVSGSVAELAYTRKHKENIIKGFEDYGFQNIEIEKI